MDLPSHTNRSLLIVRGTASFRDWVLTVNGPDATPTLEFFRSEFNTYLVDAGHVGTIGQAGVLARVFGRVFKQECSEFVGDPSRWPNTMDIELFHRFFTVEFRPMVADLGLQPFKQSNVDDDA